MNTILELINNIPYWIWCVIGFVLYLLLIHICEDYITVGRIILALFVSLFGPWTVLITGVCIIGIVLKTYWNKKIF